MAQLQNFNPCIYDEFIYTWGQAQYMAKDREKCSQLVVALCPTKVEGDK